MPRIRSAETAALLAAATEASSLRARAFESCEFVVGMTPCQLNVNAAQSIARTMPSPAIRPAKYISGTALASPLRNRLEARSWRTTPTRATITKAIFAQNHKVSPLGPPNFNHSMSGPVASKTASPPAPIRLKNLSRSHRSSRSPSGAEISRGPTWDSAIPPPMPIPTPMKCNQRSRVVNTECPLKCQSLYRSTVPMLVVISGESPNPLEGLPSLSSGVWFHR